MSNQSFTLEHEEQTWLVQDDKDHAIYLTRYITGKISIRPFHRKVDSGDEFVFIRSDPNIVLAIGRLLVAAARKAGATDA